MPRRGCSALHRVNPNFGSPFSKNTYKEVQFYSQDSLLKIEHTQKKFQAAERRLTISVRKDL